MQLAMLARIDIVLRQARVNPDVSQGAAETDAWGNRDFQSVGPIRSKNHRYHAPSGTGYQGRRMDGNNNWNNKSSFGRQGTDANDNEVQTPVKKASEFGLFRKKSGMDFHESSENTDKSFSGADGQKNVHDLFRSAYASSKKQERSFRSPSCSPSKKSDANNKWVGTPFGKTKNDDSNNAHTVSRKPKVDSNHSRFSSNLDCNKDELWGDDQHETAVRNIKFVNDAEQNKDSRSHTTVTKENRNKLSLPCAEKRLGVFNAVIANVDDDGGLWIQAQDQLSQLEKVMCEINLSSGESLEPLNNLPEVGDTCLGLYVEDGRYYRAIVKEVLPEENKALIHYVDYGNSEAVSLDHLRIIHSNFVALPRQAVHCYFNKVIRKLPLEVVDNKIEEIMLEELSISLEQDLQEDDVFIITSCSVNGANILSQLMEHEKTTEVNTSNEAEVSIDRTEIPFVSVSFESEINAYICFVDEGFFWIQTCDTVPALEELMEKLNDTESCSITPIISPTVNKLCLSQYVEDQRFYRAEIKEVRSEESMALVHYIDYGNSDSVKLESLYMLPQEYCSLPRQAVCCSFPSDIRNCWMETAQTYLEELLDQECVVSLAQETDKDKNVVCGLYFEDKDALSHIKSLLAREASTEELDKSEKHQMSDTDIDNSVSVEIPNVPFVLNSDISAFVSHVDEGSVWIQLSDTYVNLEKMEEELNATSFHPLSATPVVGSFCISQYSEDERFYRAFVKEVDTDECGAVVHYLDYGNSSHEKLEHLYDIPSNFLTLPKQAIQCFISKDFRDDCLHEAQKLLEVLINQEVVVCLTHSKEEEKTILSSCIVEEKDVISSIRALIVTDSSEDIVASAATDVSRPADGSVNVTGSFPDLSVKYREQFSAIVSHVESDCIWMQPTEGIEGLKKIMEKLNGVPMEKFDSKLLQDIPTEGFPCVFYSSCQSRYYRGIVTEIDLKRDVAFVHYIDYGIDSEVSVKDLFELPSYASSLPKQAIMCSFTEDIEKNVLKNQLGELLFQVLEVTLELKDNENNVLSVCLKDDVDILSGFRAQSKNSESSLVCTEGIAVQDGFENTTQLMTKEDISDESEEKVKEYEQDPVDVNSNDTVEKVDVLDRFEKESELTEKEEQVPTSVTSGDVRVENISQDIKEMDTEEKFEKKLEPVEQDKHATASVTSEGVRFGNFSQNRKADMEDEFEKEPELMEKDEHAVTSVIPEDVQIKDFSQNIKDEFAEEPELIEKDKHVSSSEAELIEKDKHASTSVATEDGRDENISQNIREVDMQDELEKEPELTEKDEHAATTVTPGDFRVANISQNIKEADVQDKFEKEPEMIEKGEGPSTSVIPADVRVENISQNTKELDMQDEYGEEPELIEKDVSSSEAEPIEKDKHASASITTEDFRVENISQSKEVDVQDEFEKEPDLMEKDKQVATSVTFEDERDESISQNIKEVDMQDDFAEEPGLVEKDKHVSLSEAELIEKDKHASISVTTEDVRMEILSRNIKEVVMQDELEKEPEVIEKDKCTSTSVSPEDVRVEKLSQNIKEVHMKGDFEKDSHVTSDDVRVENISQNIKEVDMQVEFEEESELIEKDECASTGVTPEDVRVENILHGIKEVDVHDEFEMEPGLVEKDDFTTTSVTFEEVRVEAITQNIKEVDMQDEFEKDPELIENDKPVPTSVTFEEVIDENISQKIKEEDIQDEFEKEPKVIERDERAFTSFTSEDVRVENISQNIEEVYMPDKFEQEPELIEKDEHVPVSVTFEEVRVEAISQNIKEVDIQNEFGNEPELIEKDSHTSTSFTIEDVRVENISQNIKEVDIQDEFAEEPELIEKDKVVSSSEAELNENDKHASTSITTEDVRVENLTQNIQEVDMHDEFEKEPELIKKDKPAATSVTSGDVEVENLSQNEEVDMHDEFEKDPELIEKDEHLPISVTFEEVSNENISQNIEVVDMQDEFEKEPEIIEMDSYAFTSVTFDGMRVENISQNIVVDMQDEFEAETELIEKDEYASTSVMPEDVRVENISQNIVVYMQDEFEQEPELIEKDEHVPGSLTFEEVTVEAISQNIKEVDMQDEFEKETRLIEKDKHASTGLTFGDVRVENISQNIKEVDVQDEFENEPELIEMNEHVATSVTFEDVRDENFSQNIKDVNVQDEFEKEQELIEKDRHMPTSESELIERDKYASTSVTFEEVTVEAISQDIKEADMQDEFEEEPKLIEKDDYASASVAFEDIKVESLSQNIEKVYVQDEFEKEPELIGKDTQVPLSISSEDVSDIKEVDVIDEFKKDFEPSENEQVPKCHISDNVIEGNLAQNVEKVNMQDKHGDLPMSERDGQVPVKVIFDNVIDDNFVEKVGIQEEYEEEFGPSKKIQPVPTTVISDDLRYENVGLNTGKVDLQVKSEKELEINENTGQVHTSVTVDSVVAENAAQNIKEVNVQDEPDKELKFNEKDRQVLESVTAFDLEELESHNAGTVAVIDQIKKCRADNGKTVTDEVSVAECTIDQSKIKDDDFQFEKLPPLVSLTKAQPKPKISHESVDLDELVGTEAKCIEYEHQKISGDVFIGEDMHGQHMIQKSSSSYLNDGNGLEKDDENTDDGAKFKDGNGDLSQESEAASVKEGVELFDKEEPSQTIEGMIRGTSLENIVESSDGEETAVQMAAVVPSEEPIKHFGDDSSCIGGSFYHTETEQPSRDTEPLLFHGGKEAPKCSGGDQFCVGDTFHQSDTEVPLKDTLKCVVGPVAKDCFEERETSGMLIKPSESHETASQEQELVIAGENYKVKNDDGASLRKNETVDPDLEEMLEPKPLDVVDDKPESNCSCLLDGKPIQVRVKASDEGESVIFSCGCLQSIDSASVKKGKDVFLCINNVT